MLNVTQPVPKTLVHNPKTIPPVLVVMPPNTEFQIQHYKDKNHSDVFVKNPISTINKPKNVHLVTHLVEFVTEPQNGIVKLVLLNTK